MRLRESEIAEQLAGQLAIEEIRAEKRAAARDPDSAPDVDQITGEEAANLADKPMLTGDPEWDAMEIEATLPENAAR
ncbi:MAG: hypothetical protein M3Q55_15340 [Acidobacteriota bacterium]|nr:hypothetical protein [Acidobacteriota bacterium]